MHTPNENPLADFVDLRELLPRVKQTFPTEQSLKWFVRQHRAELAESGALIVITGRLRFHPQRFMEAGVAIGRNQAMGRTA
jgi:hypothetical protein